MPMMNIDQPKNFINPLASYSGCIMLPEITFAEEPLGMGDEYGDCAIGGGTELGSGTPTGDAIAGGGGIGDATGTPTAGGNPTGAAEG